MDALKEIGILMRNAKAIEEATKTYQKCKQDSSCDKHNFNFNKDERFSACTGFTLRVDSWKGYYGNSGCSSILSVDHEVFNKHLLKVLREDFWPILNKVQESILDEARGLKTSASEELKAKLETIENL